MKSTYRIAVRTEGKRNRQFFIAQSAAQAALLVREKTPKGYHIHGVHRGEERLNSPRRDRELSDLIGFGELTIFDLAPDEGTEGVAVTITTEYVQAARKK